MILLIFEINYFYILEISLRLLIENHLNEFQAPSDLVSDGFISPYIFTYGSLLSIAMSLLVSLFLIFPLVERTSGAKHLQMMTGLHPATFWITNLAWDFLIYLASSTMMIVFLMAFDYDKTFTSFQAPGNY